jgi:hypothetical protein
MIYANYIQHGKSLEMVYDSLTHSPLFTLFFGEGGLFHRLKYKTTRRFGIRLCFSLHVKIHLTWWTH